MHFIGKDNIGFHTIIFPSILNSLDGYNLPVNVPANEFMNLEGSKLSTSRGWTIKIDEFIEEFPDKVDELRYVLISNMPETKDSEFTWSDFQTKINSELVATYGNFINRVFVLMHKYFDGNVPDFDENITINCGVEPNTDSKYVQEIDDLVNRTFQYFELIKKFKFREALAKLIDIASFGNSILQFNEPWKKIKEDEEHVKTVMNVAIRIVAVLAAISDPILPVSSKKLKEALVYKENTILNYSYKDLFKRDLFRIFKSHRKINTCPILFSKIEDEIIASKKEGLEHLKNRLVESKAKDDLDENITFDTFQKLKLKIGTILEVENVENSRSLYKLLVDIGTEKRTIVSGVSKSLTKEDLLDKQVVVLTNLDKKKIMGIESNGMILFAEEEKNFFVLSTKEKIKNGATVK